MLSNGLHPEHFQLDIPLHMIKPLPAFVLIAGIFTCCTRERNASPPGIPAIPARVRPAVTAADTTLVAILPFDDDDPWIDVTGKPTTLAGQELLETDRLLRQAIAQYNPGQEKEWAEISKKYPNDTFNRDRFVINLPRYKRQYMPYLNPKGEKEVWINCFCRFQGQDWRKSPVFVLDGGNCYFNLKVNLSRGTYYDLMVNGSA